MVTTTRTPGDDRVWSTLETLVDDLAPTDLELGDGEAPPPPAGSQRYLEEGLIGRGGLGEVVAAYDQDLRRRVALKRVRPDRTNTAMIARLVQEAQVTAQLDHPNIPPIHGLGIDAEGRVFFAMAHIHGWSLAQLMASADEGGCPVALTMRRRLTIALQVGYALAYAHQHGVVHRDVKPDNVMVGRMGEVWLMDWGLAKVRGRSDVEGAAPVSTDAGAPQTRLGSVAGTPGFMSPEQAFGRADIDGRSDVYSLGALLYALIAGRAPVDLNTPRGALYQTAKGQVRPLREQADGVSVWLAAIVHKALATERDDRYQTASEMVADLEALLEGRAVAALGDESVVDKVGRFYLSRHPRIARLRIMDVDLGLGGMTLVGMALGIWFSGSLQGWQWPLLLGGLAMTGPITYIWWRRPKLDDPSLLYTTSTRPPGAIGSQTDS